MSKSPMCRFGIMLAGAAMLIFLVPSLLCQSRKGKALAEEADKTLLVPAFTISVKLSDEAQKRLQQIHESVLVIAYFDGDALPGQGKDNAPFRDVLLGSDEKLMDARNVATFADTKISQSNWNRLSDKNYFLTINVVSARKASKNNLLDCRVPEDRISTFAGKATEVSCRLIGDREGSAK